jgi:ABC-type multidrug transport system fused ATPase/permease subunit
LPPLPPAPLVILDEPTSHLDRASETVIRDAVRRLAQDRTILIVSHRLRFVAMADEILVLEAGRVVESGPPGDLIGRDGTYRGLVRAGALGGAAPS